MGNSEPEDPVGIIDATYQDVEHLRGVYCVTLQRAHSSSYALALPGCRPSQSPQLGREQANPAQERSSS